MLDDDDDDEETREEEYENCRKRKADDESTCEPKLARTILDKTMNTVFPDNELANFNLSLL